MKWPWQRSRSREQELSDFFDGSLRGRRAHEIEEAAAADPDARRKLTAYAALREAVRLDPTASDDQPDDDYLASVMRRVEATRADAVASRSRGWRVWALACGVAAVAVVAVVTWRAVSPESMDPAPLVSSAPPADAPVATAPAESPREDAAMDLRSSAGGVEPASVREAAEDESDTLSTADAGAAAPSVAAGRSPRTSAASTDAEAPVSLVSARVAADETRLPYTLQVTDGDVEMRSVGMSAGAGLDFSLQGVRYVVSVERDEDGRWAVMSEYRPDGELLATESRERRFRLDEEAPLARFRIAQPLARATRLYAVVVATEDPSEPTQVTPPAKGPANAPE